MIFLGILFSDKPKSNHIEVFKGVGENLGTESYDKSTNTGYLNVFKGVFLRIVGKLPADD